MALIQTKLDTSSERFQKDKAAALEIADQIKKVREDIQASYRQTSPSFQESTLCVYDRVHRLLDPGTSFLEIGTFAGYSAEPKDNIPSAGSYAGIGQVSGRTCIILANNPAVKGGTYFPISVKKHLRAQEIAWKNKLPCLYLVDSGGAFLPKQSEVFPDKDDFGRIFFNQARLSAANIPQIAVVHGLCTAGGAYIPAMSDQAVIVEGRGCIFLAGPPLVKAATGEEVTAEELGGASVHAEKSGVVDYRAQSDEQALAIVRKIVSHLKPHRGFAGQTDAINFAEIKEPNLDQEDLMGIIPQDPKKSFDIREIIGRVVDGSEFLEFKKDYGTTLVTGFGHLMGIPVGIIANNGVLFSESSLKGAHFIQLCCQEKRPLIFLQNVTGFIVGKDYEAQGIAKDGAKLVHAVSVANVPKLTCIVGGSFGAGNYGMCGRAYDPDFLFMWPNARISVMGGEQAANVLLSVKQAQAQKKGLKPLSKVEIEAIQQPILEQYEKESSALYSSSMLWDDNIIDPRQTRAVLGKALSSCLNFSWDETVNGIYRM